MLELSGILQLRGKGLSQISGIRKLRNLHFTSECGAYSPQGAVFMACSGSIPHACTLLFCGWVSLLVCSLTKRMLKTKWNLMPLVYNTFILNTDNGWLSYKEGKVFTSINGYYAKMQQKCAHLTLITLMFLLVVMCSCFVLFSVPLESTQSFDAESSGVAYYFPLIDVSCVLFFFSIAAFAHVVLICSHPDESESRF